MILQEREKPKHEPAVKLPARKEASPQRAQAGRSILNTFKMRSSWHKRGILLAAGIISAVIISPRAKTTVHEYSSADIARQDIKAPYDFLIEDIPSTLMKREEAMAASLSVYDFDDDAASEVGNKLGNTFSVMREYLAEIAGRAEEAIRVIEQDGGTGKKPKLEKLITSYIEESREERYLAFEGLLSVKADSQIFRTLEMNKFTEDIENVITDALVPMMRNGVVSSKELISQEKEKGIVVRNIKDKNEKIVSDISSFYSLEKAREKVSRDIYSHQGKQNTKVLEAASMLAASLVRPTLTFNKSETEERKNIAADAANPAFFQIKEGEMILREGERVTADHLLKLEVLSRQDSVGSDIINYAGYFLLITVVLYSLYHFSIHNIRKISLDVRDLLFLGILLIVTLIFFRISIPAAEALKEAFPHIPEVSYQYLFSAAAAAMLVRIVLNSETAIVFSVAVSMVVAMVVKDSFIFWIYTMVGCIAGAQAVRFCNDRVAIIKAGFYVAAVNLLMILIMALAYGERFDSSITFSALFGILGGIATGVLVTGLAPVVEWLFGYTTNFKLLEIASLDHPLLKELITQAPGTYHHSWIIANLVEKAAEAINANPLLARVSALYHDIGKIKKPQYFYENQKGQKNPHDKLAPSLSGLILIGHVKDGIELAREYKLGKSITDIIPQHHGTRLISYFYSKAKEQENPHVHEVDEEDFRYLGPKPQTKEAGLVMLADAVEAATRTIQDPTPAKIKATVKRLIGEIFGDGQLEECELTLKDLNEIAKSFVHVLLGIYHTRIEYPDTEKEDRFEGPNRVKKEAKRNKKAGGGKNGEKNSSPSSLH